MALRIVRLFWWHAKQFVCPLPPSFPLFLPLFIPSLSVALFLLSKICHIKKTDRGRNSSNGIYNNESTVWREHQEHQERARERERSALPCRRRKSFVLPSPRVASALLGWCCCCCCCWSLRTATAAAAVQFCFQRRHDWTRALQESRSRTLNSTLVNNYAVCVSRCVRVCVRTSLAVACVRPANAARNFKLGNIHKVKAKVIPLSTTDKSTNWQWPI